MNISVRWDNDAERILATVPFPDEIVDSLAVALVGDSYTFYAQNREIYSLPVSDFANADRSLLQGLDFGIQTFTCPGAATTIEYRFNEMEIRSPDS